MRNKNTGRFNRNGHAFFNGTRFTKCFSYLTLIVCEKVKLEFHH